MVNVQTYEARETLILLALGFWSKGKDKVHPRTGHEGPEEKKRYSSTLSLTSTLDGVGGQHHTLATLPLGKTQNPLYRRLGGLQGRSGWVQKTFPSPEFDPWTVQPVASHYTYYTILAHRVLK
jgi:hypothetical protein